MDGPRDCHTKSNIKDKYHMVSLVRAIKRNGTNEPIYKTIAESQMQKTNL